MKKIIYSFSIILLSAMHGYSAKQIVNTQNFSFSPSSFTINLGDTIKWQWVGGNHTTTSGGIPAGAVAWNAPLNSSNSVFLYVPAVAGTYNYVCSPHAGIGMVGSFTVTGCPQVSGQVSASGSTTVCKPLSVTLNCNATAGASFQWLKNGANISGATSSSYNATATGMYRVKLSNNCGSKFTTNVIAVTVNAMPVAVIAGNDTVLKCAADSVTLDGTSTTTGVTYQWMRGSMTIAGATGSKYKTKKAGTYKVIVAKTSTGCSKTSKAVHVINNCRDGGELISSEFVMELYPNPASQQVNLSFKASDNSATFQIINITGQVLMQKEMQSGDNNFEEAIDISKLPAGVYTMLVQANSGSAHRLFVKE